MDLKRRMLHVRVQDGWKPKDSEGRAIPMPSALVDLLTTWKKGSETTGADDLVFPSEADTPLIVANVHHRLVKAAKQAGIRCNWYTLRHTHGSWLAQAGRSLHMIARFMGHSSITVTEKHYAGLQPEKLHEAVEVLSSQNRQSGPY